MVFRNNIKFGSIDNYSELLSAYQIDARYLNTARSQYIMIIFLLSYHKKAPNSSSVRARCGMILRV